MIKANLGEMGLVFDLSGVADGNKPINGPFDLAIDGNSNIMVLSKDEGIIHKYKMKLVNQGNQRRFRFKTMKS